MFVICRRYFFPKILSTFVCKSRFKQISTSQLIFGIIHFMENKNSNQNKTVFIGMSGGVDSSVSAALLKEQGYEVVGVYMDLQKYINSKFSQENTASAQSVCDQLSIELKVWNFAEDFQNLIISNFLKNYEKGLTPNPCVRCNKIIKFGEFYKKAIDEGADFVATGHYAQIKKVENEYRLIRGTDLNKDQSYFLYNLTQEILAKTLLPVGDLNKTKVREIAERFNLKVAQREDSQDVCFIQNGNTNEFLGKNIETKKGEIIDIDTNKVIGTHSGLIFYTIGQRKGIEIGADQPYFVIDKDVVNNKLFVGKGLNHPKLFKQTLEVNDLFWISGKEPKYPFDAEIQTRYRQKPTQATILNSNQISLSEPIRAISPGQRAVIYQGEVCLGGGVIG
jgi:tRNA-specific 2-thiouridylase